MIAGGANTMADTSSPQDSVFRCPDGIEARWNVVGNSTVPTTYNSGTGMEFTRSFSQGTNTRIDCWYCINGWVTTDGGLTNATNEYGRYPFSMQQLQVGFKQFQHKMTDFRDSANLVLVFDGLYWHQQSPFAISARHNSKKAFNAVFADGHVQSLLAPTATSPGDVPVDNTTTPPTLKKYVGGGPRFILTSQLTFP